MDSQPYYLPLKNEVKVFEEAFRMKLPVLLKGPTGCGKTRFVEYMATKLFSSPNAPEVPLRTVACHEDLSSTDLAGHYIFDLKRGAVWVDGPLARSARAGGICYLDEVAEARADVTVLIHPLSDHRRLLSLPQTGEEITAHSTFMLVLSFNPGYQSLIKEMKPSTRQRFVTIEFTYPSIERESEIIVAESRVDKLIARRLAEAAVKIRNMKEHGLTEGVSTRLLIYAAHFVHGGMPMEAALEAGVIQALTDDRDIAQAIREIFRSYGLDQLRAAA